MCAWCTAHQRYITWRPPVSQGCGWPTGECVHVHAWHLWVSQYAWWFGIRVAGHRHMHAFSWTPLLSQPRDFISFSLLTLPPQQATLKLPAVLWDRTQSAKSYSLCGLCSAPWDLSKKRDPKMDPRAPEKRAGTSVWAWSHELPNRERLHVLFIFIYSYLNTFRTSGWIPSRPTHSYKYVL